MSQVIESEEQNFLGTIDGGLDRINRIFDTMRSENRGTVTGAEAAEMYTTHGFPPELFETMAAEHNFVFDWEGYQKEMEKHGELSGAGERGALFKKDPLESLKKAIHGSEFLGYDTLSVDDAKIIGIISNEKLVDKIDEVSRENPVVVVLNKTPFYGEKGGQVGDSGTLTGKAFTFEVSDTKCDGDFMLHVGHLREGSLSLGEKVKAEVDAERGREFAGPIRRRMCCTTPCESTWASTPNSRARRWTRTSSGSISPTPRPSRRTYSRQLRKK